MVEIKKGPEIFQGLFLCFTSGSKIQWNRWLLVVLNCSVRLFKAANVIVQCLEQLFGMLWGQYYPALYLGFWSAGHQANKVHHKFRDGVVDDGKIDKNETTVCYVTGNGLKATESIMQVLTKPQVMQADVAKISAVVR